MSSKLNPARAIKALALGAAVIAVMAVIAALAVSGTASAQPARGEQGGQGGLYIAGDGFAFETAAQRGLAHNRGGQRFFLLTLPSEAGALRRRAPAPQARLRDQVLAANGVLLVCQRDLDNGHIDAAELVAEVVAVRGWPPQHGSGSNALPHGQRYFPGEDRRTLPAANEALRRLRSACA